jgi:hypothetical protein
LKPTSTGNNVRDKFVTIPYTETPFAEQKLATTDGVETVQAAMIAKFEGFVTLTPESDYFYSLEHQPQITDSLGRFFELRQVQYTPDPALTTAVIRSIGAGNYLDTTYFNTVISGQNFPITVNPVVEIPAYAAPVNVIDAPVTQPININITGVAPFTFLNSTWTGQISEESAAKSEDIFTPDWNRNGILSADSFVSRYDV